MAMSGASPSPLPHRRAAARAILLFLSDLAASGCQSAPLTQSLPSHCPVQSQSLLAAPHADYEALPAEPTAHAASSGTARCLPFLALPICYACPLALHIPFLIFRCPLCHGVWPAPQSRIIVKPPRSLILHNARRRHCISLPSWRAPPLPTNHRPHCSPARTSP